MPRQARIECPEGYYHIINRGMERKNIFRDAKDYVFFLQILSGLLCEEGVECYAWVLMPNHFHLFIRRGAHSVGRFMSRLQTRYAGYFNRKYRRAGRLFQNRYKAILCSEETYFQELVAYIHLNPLRKKLVKDITALADYRWSGHRGLVEKENLPWMAVKEVLGRFGTTRREARQRYCGFLSERVGVTLNLSGGGLIRSAGGLRALQGKEQEDKQEYDSRILGDGEFVKNCLKRSGEEQAESLVDVPKTGVIFERTAAAMEIALEQVSRKGKSSPKAACGRGVAVYIACEYNHEHRTELAERLGISQPAVSKLYRQGERLIRGNPSLLKAILKAKI